jgi:hypothetical protein
VAHLATQPKGAFQAQSPFNHLEKKSRWAQPIVPNEIQTFVSQYMPWVVEQKRRVPQENGFGGIGIGAHEVQDVTNLLKLNEENRIDKFAAIEQT